MISKRYNGEKKPAWTLRLAISMGDEKAIKWLHETYGGWLLCLPVDIRHGHRRPRFILRYETEAAFEILKILYPYLKVKKPQAALAFKFRELMKQTFGSKDAHHHQLRDEMVEKMKRLNRPWLGAVETVRAETPSESVIQSDLDGDIERVTGDRCSALIN